MFFQRDIELDTDLDLKVGVDGDLVLASEAKTLRQDIEFRLRTEHKEYEPQPYIGADLRRFVGYPNTFRTAELIKENIINSLTQDLRIIPATLFVDVVPISINKVKIFVLVKDSIVNSDQPLLVSVTLNLDPSDGLDQESIINTGVLP